MTTPPPSPTLTVRVAPFEYECCRTPPAVGASISGALIAYPTSHHRVRVTDWDRERDLVVVHGGVARWDPRYGDPFTTPLRISLSWHLNDGPGVDVTATVGELSQVYLGSPDDPTDRETLIPVDRVDRFPEPLVTPYGAFEPGGAVVTLTDLLLVETTVEHVADFRAQQERRRRTINITAAPAFFGPTVPHIGDRVAVDLDEPTITVRNNPSRARGVVTGVAIQVKEAVAGPMFTAFTRARAGAPAADIDRDLYVVLVLDEPL